MKYRLSNRQLKELKIRGSEITIAIPVPIDEPDDSLAYVRSVLDVNPSYVRSVVADTVAVAPGSGGGLTSIVGCIVDRDAAAKAFHFCIDAYIVRLSEGRPRRTFDVPQWPASVEANGMIFPRAVQADPE